MIREKKKIERWVEGEGRKKRGRKNEKRKREDERR